MRTRLILLGICLLAPYAFGVEKSDGNKKDYVRPYVVSPQTVQSPPPAGGFPLMPHQRSRGLRLPANNTCLTLHTLQVEKKRGSDETEFTGQRTCTPASQFEVKNADQRP